MTNIQNILSVKKEDCTWQEIWQISIHFIQGSLKWPFSELFFTVVSLWNQYEYIAFSIFFCSIWFRIIAGISNETTNELTIYAILCRNVTKFYRQEVASLFQVQQKLKACKNSKLNILSSCYMKHKPTHTLRQEIFTAWKFRIYVVEIWNPWN